MTEKQENLYMLAQNIAYLTSAIETLKNVITDNDDDKNDLNRAKKEIFVLREWYFGKLEELTKQTDEN